VGVWTAGADGRHNAAVPTLVYTAGVREPGADVAGWAWVVPAGRFACGASSRAPRTRMQLAAIVEALRALPGQLEIVTDAPDVAATFLEDRWPAWEARGWRSRAGREIPDRDLWESLVAACRERGGPDAVQIVTMNEPTNRGSGYPVHHTAAELARAAAASGRSWSGDEVPEAVTAGPVVEHGSGNHLTGFPLGVFGPKPPGLGGFPPNPVLDRLRSRLAGIITTAAARHHDLRLVCGLRPGTELAAAEAAVEVGVPVDVVLPYPDPVRSWPEKSQEQFRQGLKLADRVLILQKRMPTSRHQAGLGLARKDAWVVRRLATAVLVWDGRDETFRAVHRDLQAHLGPALTVIDPGDLGAPRLPG
jgi:ribonuclease HI/uncharacterized phage-like protein YoqJ